MPCTNGHSFSGRGRLRLRLPANSAKTGKWRRWRRPSDPWRLGVRRHSRDSLQRPGSAGRDVCDTKWCEYGGATWRRYCSTAVDATDAGHAQVLVVFPMYPICAYIYSLVALQQRQLLLCFILRRLHGHGSALVDTAVSPCKLRPAVRQSAPHMHPGTWSCPATGNPSAGTNPPSPSASPMLPPCHY